MSDNANDDLLDATLDDLADLPGFTPFPVGVHLCTLTMAVKEVNKKPSVEVKLKYIEPVEMANPNDIPPKVGDETNILYMLKNNDGSPNEIAQGQLKATLQTLKEAGLPGGSNREMIANTKDGIRVAAVTKQRENKQSGQMNTVLVKFEVVG